MSNEKSSFEFYWRLMMYLRESVQAEIWHIKHKTACGKYALLPAPKIKALPLAVKRAS
jgi:hypothetical protein